MVISHLANYYTEHLNENDKSKLATTLLSKIIPKQLEINDENNKNAINIITNPIKEIGWNDEK